MLVSEAIALPVLSYVYCPADRGEPAYRGVVMSVGKVVQKTSNGTEYVWVTVRHANGKQSAVWPSNRLGRA